MLNSTKKVEDVDRRGGGRCNVLSAPPYASYYLALHLIFLEVLFAELWLITVRTRTHQEKDDGQAWIAALLDRLASIGDASPLASYRT